MSRGCPPLDAACSVSSYVRASARTLAEVADRRFLARAAGWSVLALVAFGLVAAIIPNPVFGRSVPPAPFAIAVWLLSAPLMGLIAATYGRLSGLPVAGPAVAVPLGRGSTAVPATAPAAGGPDASGSPGRLSGPDVSGEPGAWAPIGSATSVAFSGAVSPMVSGAATATVSGAAPQRGTMSATVGSVAAFLAIGCPLCNKIALLLLGASGALTIWAPLQPVIGAASLVLLAGTLAWRLRLLEQGGACAS